VGARNGCFHHNGCGGSCCRSGRRHRRLLFRQEAREKQNYEQQRAAQQQQEAREQEQNERRAEALNEIKTSAAVVVEDVRSWAENTATSLDVEKLPPTNQGFWKRNMQSSLDRQEELVQKYAEIVEQRDHIAAKMETLRSYYWEQRPYLLPTQRSLFESFDNASDRRFSPLSAQLPAYETVRQRFTKENFTGGERMIVTVVNAYTLGLVRDKLETGWFVPNAIKTWEK